MTIHDAKQTNFFLISNKPVSKICGHLTILMMIITTMHGTRFFVSCWTTTSRALSCNHCPRSHFKDTFVDFRKVESSRVLLQRHSRILHGELKIYQSSSSSNRLMMMNSADNQNNNHNGNDLDENESETPSIFPGKTPSDLGTNEVFFSNNKNITSTNTKARGGVAATLKNKNNDNSFLHDQQKTIEDIVRKKIRVARAQAEIDRILTGPDPPFDMDKEWSKVTSIAPSNSNIVVNQDEHHDNKKDSKKNSRKKDERLIKTEHDISTDKDAASSLTNENSEENQSNATDSIISDVSLVSVEDKAKENDQMQQQQQQVQHELACEELEQELYQAVKCRDLDKASAKRKALDQLLIENANAALQANAAFYKAFSAKDYDVMAKIWIPDSTATCIHPYYKKPVIGCRAVLNDWKSIFEGSKKRSGPSATFQKSWIEPSNIHIATIGASSMVIITCNENVFVRRFVRGEKRQTLQVNTLQATNIYRKINGMWYLQHHHASATTAGNKQQQQPIQVQSNSKFYNKRTVLYNNNKFDESDDAEDENNLEIGMDGILGIRKYGADLGTSAGKKSLLLPAAQNQQQQPKRIIMGSLADLLNGNLGDLLSSDIRNKLGDNINNDGSAVIRFSRIEDNDEDEEEDYYDDDDDDEDDEEDFDYEEDDEEDLERIQEDLVKSLNRGKKGNEASLAIIKRLNDAEFEKLKQQKMLSSKANVTSVNLERMKEQTQTKDDHQQQPQEKQHQLRIPNEVIMRQECIAKLRKLTQQGLLSPSHKRVLLTDIISCSAATTNRIVVDNLNKEIESSVYKKSMVQVAYELLLGSDYNSYHGATNNEEAATPENRKDVHADFDFSDIAEEEFAEQCRVFAEGLLTCTK